MVQYYFVLILILTKKQKEQFTIDIVFRFILDNDRKYMLTDNINFQFNLHM